MNRGSRFADFMTLQTPLVIDSLAIRGMQDAAATRFNRIAQKSRAIVRTLPLTQIARGYMLLHLLLTRFRFDPDLRTSTREAVLRARTCVHTHIHRIRTQL